MRCYGSLYPYIIIIFPRVIIIMEYGMLFLTPRGGEVSPRKRKGAIFIVAKSASAFPTVADVFQRDGPAHASHDGILFLYVP